MTSMDELEDNQRPKDNSHQSPDADFSTDSSAGAEKSHPEKDTNEVSNIASDGLDTQPIRVHFDASLPENSSELGDLDLSDAADQDEIDDEKVNWFGELTDFGNLESEGPPTPGKVENQWQAEIIEPELNQPTFRRSDANCVRYTNFFKRF